MKGANEIFQKYFKDLKLAKKSYSSSNNEFTPFCGNECRSVLDSYNWPWNQSGFSWLVIVLEKYTKFGKTNVLLCQILSLI